MKKIFLFLLLFIVITKSYPQKGMWYFVWYENEVCIPSGLASEPFYSEQFNRDSLERVALMLTANNEKVRYSLPGIALGDKKDYYLSEKCKNARYKTDKGTEGPFKSKKAAKRMIRIFIMMEHKMHFGKLPRAVVYKNSVIKLSDEEREILKEANYGKLLAFIVNSYNK